MISPVKLSYLNIGSGHVKNVVGGCMEEGLSVETDHEIIGAS